MPMNVPTSRILALAMIAALGGCSGGGSSSLPTSTTTGTQSADQSSVNTAQSVGDEANSIKSVNDGTNSPLTAQSFARGPMSVALGTCNNGEIFASPDAVGDPNSTETKYFYDTACTQLSRDVVRVYTATGTGAESVVRTDSQYAPGSAVASAVRATTNLWASASFDRYGFPIASSGYHLNSTSTLSLGTTRVDAASHEQIMSAAVNGVETFCGDGASYNVTGFAKLGTTNGVAGIETSGTRTVNSDGSVTFAVTHNETQFKGSIGALSINAGSANTVCPIATPEFTIAGGAQTGTATIPISVTYKHGVLSNLTISNAALSSGNVLNLATSASASASSVNFITGGIKTAAGATVATVAVDAFGDGTLTVASSGNVYVINDWIVVK